MNIYIQAKSVILPLALGVLLTSCATATKYETPPQVVEQTLYRTDQLPQDSLSFGDVSWREIFTDPILQGHIQKALDNNIDVRIALQNIVSAEAYLKQSKAAYLPTINIGPNYTFNTQSLNTQSGQMLSERTHNSQWDLTGALNWEIDIWGKMASEQRAQMASYLGTVSAHQSIKSDLVAAVAASYFQLLTFDEQKRIINETISLREKNLETTQALKDAGSLTEVAVQQSEALVHNAESLLINIDIQIELLENTMSLLLAEPSAAITRSTLEDQNLPIALDLGYPSQLLSNRPDVRMAELNLVQAFELSKAAKAQFYPRLTITGSGGLQSKDIDNLFSANSLFANVVGGLLQPVLNKRQIKTQYEVSLANKEIAYLNFRRSVLTAGKEVSDAIKMYSSQDSFIALKQKELDAYRKSVEFSQELVNYGMANYLEVLNASVNQLNAELNISNARYAKMQSGIELYRALGGGWK
ncbi:TolC family protein [Chryseobacterium sp. A321]